MTGAIEKKTKHSGWNKQWLATEAERTQQEKREDGTAMDINNNKRKNNTT